jgi:hypothetical protein
LTRLPITPSIRCGRIIYTWIEDRNGFGKLRPAIVMTEDIEIDNDTELVVMAITTTYADPTPAVCVPLPWHSRGHPITRLHKRSAAVVTWLASIFPRDVVGYGGDVPVSTMRLIRAKLDALDD